MTIQNEVSLQLLCKLLWYLFLAKLYNSQEGIRVFCYALYIMAATGNTFSVSYSMADNTRITVKVQMQDIDVKDAEDW